jgi:hypothetical protein
MGMKCSCDCNSQHNIIHSKNLYELAEAMEEENELLLRETKDINNNTNPTDNKNRLKDFFLISNLYIKKFKSLPDGYPNDGFIHLREIINKCYHNILSEEEFNSYYKEMEYLVEVKMARTLGI